MASFNLGGFTTAKGFNFYGLGKMDFFDGIFHTAPLDTGVKIYFDKMRDYTEIKGHGLEYIVDDDGEIEGFKAGTVTSLTYVDGGKSLINVTGLNISAQSLSDAFDDDGDFFDALPALLCGDDKMKGTDYADTLTGFEGDDTLSGGKGNDKLYAGEGADDLYAGSGKDAFIFKSVFDSTVSGRGRDTIFDFSAKEGDRVDLSTIDANIKASGNQAFIFIGNDKYSGKAGELRYDKKASDTYISGDTNGDGKADFAIHLDDAVSIYKGYFIL